LINVAVIPARGSYQILPKKNIIELHGKPLIAYSIEAAIESKLFDRIIVSTDCEEIASVARLFGAETPFVRPSDLADHYTGTTQVFQHAITWLEKEGSEIDRACMIYATCPLLKPQYLIEGFNMLSHAKFSFAATSFAFPIQRALMETKSGHVEPMYPEFIQHRSQDLVEDIHDSGQFYWARAEDLLKNPDFFGPNSKPVKLPRCLVQDLDTAEDFEVLKQLLELHSA
jgi:N-acylneuraminate cytidylyltransferase